MENKISKWLSENKKMSWVLGIIGTVFLGALGSGLWNLFLEPVSLGLGRSLFSIATLGLNSLRNSVYEDIAKGLHEEPSLMLFSAFLILPFFVLSSYRGYLSGRKAAKIETDALVAEIEKQISDVDERSIETQKRLEEERNKARQKANKVAVLALIMLAVFCFFQMVTVRYTNSAITHFRQCLAITEPVLGEETAKDVTSRFARIKSKDDYVAVLQELYRIAATKGYKCPVFAAL